MPLYYFQSWGSSANTTHVFLYQITTVGGLSLLWCEAMLWQWATTKPIEPGLCGIEGQKRPKQRSSKKSVVLPVLIVLKPGA